jgi:hypothetical protein
MLRGLACSILLLWPQLVMAAEPVAPADVQVVPEGAIVVVPPSEGRPEVRFQLSTKSWVISDAYFREAVAKAKELEVTRPALTACTQTTLDLAVKVRSTAETCLTQFDGDEARIDTLVQTVSTLEVRALDAERKLQTTRTQRTIAWTIVGGLIAGSAITLGVVFGK